MRHFTVIICMVAFLLIVSCDTKENNEVDLAGNNNTAVEVEKTEADKDNVKDLDDNKDEIDNSTDDEHADDTLSSLSISKFSLNNGFFLGSNHSFVKQTFVSPKGEHEQLAVHFVRQIQEGEPSIYRSDAVVVNPETHEFDIYPLTEAYVNETYNVDSVTGGYGFIDEDHLIYVAVVGEDPSSGNFTYRIEKINIRNGQKEILFPDIPGVPMDDFFARGWLTADKNTLFLNTFRSGKWWAFDIQTGKINTSDRSFSHSWPLFLTSPSPDGQSFWHADIDTRNYGLYDLTGHLISEIPFSSGYDQYPPFQWSDEGKYSAYAYTRDQNYENVISEEEVYVIAPQGIHFRDHNGELVRSVETGVDEKEYVELASWLDNNDQVLLHYFKLAENKEKITSSYERIHLKTGQTQVYQLKDDLGDLLNPSPEQPIKYGSLYWIDAENRIYITERLGTILKDDQQNGWAWLTDYNSENSSYSLHRFDPIRSGYSAQKIRTELEQMQRAEALMNDWIIWNDMHYTKLIPMNDE